MEKVLRTVTYQGQEIVVSCDSKGNVYVNERLAFRPVKTDDLTFVWAGKSDGLPPHTKISLTDEMVSIIDEMAQEHVAEVKELVRKEREFDELYNEGGEGFNPYRDGGSK